MDKVVYHDKQPFMMGCDSWTSHTVDEMASNTA